MSTYSPANHAALALSAGTWDEESTQRSEQNKIDKISSQMSLILVQWIKMESPTMRRSHALAATTRKMTTTMMTLIPTSISHRQSAPCLDAKVSISSHIIWEDIRTLASSWSRRLCRLRRDFWKLPLCLLQLPTQWSSFHTFIDRMTHIIKEN